MGSQLSINAHILTVQLMSLFREDMILLHEKDARQMYGGLAIIDLLIYSTYFETTKWI